MLVFTSFSPYVVVVGHSSSNFVSFVACLNILLYVAARCEGTTKKKCMCVCVYVYCMYIENMFSIHIHWPGQFELTSSQMLFDHSSSIFIAQIHISV